MTTSTKQHRYPVTILSLDSR